jgi:hypothetical protein
LLSTLHDSPKAKEIVNALMADREGARRETRTGLVATRARLTASLEAAHAKRSAPRTREQAEIARCQAALDAAHARYAEHEGRWRGEMSLLDGERTRAETRLRETASPLIEELRRKAYQERDRTWAMRDDISEMGINGVLQVVWTNEPTVTARAAAVQELINDIQAWHLEDHSDATLQARFDQLIAALPAVDPRPAMERGILGWLFS